MDKRVDVISKGSRSRRAVGPAPDEPQGGFQIHPLRRVAIEAVVPEVDAGRFPIKRIVGDEVVVEADVFADGHEPVRAVLLYRHERDRNWMEVPMEPLGNDRWRARFPVTELGTYVYTVEGWMDRPEGRSLSTRYDRTLRVVVDRPRARFGSWYEIFPRSWGKVPGRHASFRELEDGLPYIASMGFDVLYLTPIHPIARTHRKGRNNALVAGPDDPGSPWAIGSPEGGHKAIHPQLGTLDDFRHFLLKAKEFGLEIALDIALHCSPDHPYVKEHPEWFRRGPDGTIRYAENPPKKYEDIYPLDFESPQAEALWTELKSIFEFWMAQGVKIFRIDNPHTKPFAFWEWLIADLKRQDPEVLFLSEAFTRPKVMMRLAKLGFSQSYTYFCWRTTRKELTDYFTELTQTSVREYFRPSVWPNTPDILIGYLQTGGPAAFQVRLILAATLAATYGIYGPAFELCEHTPREPGSEEYLNSEKYEIKAWDLDAPTSLREWIARVNRIRRDHPALQRDDGLQFHSIDNDQLICYSKRTPSNDDRILVVVNLDPHHAQSGWTDLRLEELDLRAEVPFRIKDLLTGNEYTWHGPKNFVHLDPQVAVAHLFHVMGP